VSILLIVFSQSSASNGSAACVNTGGRWLMNSHAYSWAFVAVVAEVDC
jgi:hypothetical protein